MDMDKHTGGSTGFTHLPCSYSLFFLHAPYQLWPLSTTTKKSFEEDAVGGTSDTVGSVKLRSRQRRELRGQERKQLLRLPEKWSSWERGELNIHQCVTAAPPTNPPTATWQLATLNKAFITIFKRVFPGPLIHLQWFIFTQIASKLRNSDRPCSYKSTIIITISENAIFSCHNLILLIIT